MWNTDMVKDSFVVYTVLSSRSFCVNEPQDLQLFVNEKKSSSCTLWLSVCTNLTSFKTRFFWN